MLYPSFLGLQGLVRRRIAIAVGLALSAAAANAQTATEEAKTLPKVSVAAPEPEDTPKVDRVSSPKFTQDLIDTPQTIAIVSQQVLQQQGATTLSQALRNTPGVTFLLGENGNTATGDSIFMLINPQFVDEVRIVTVKNRDILRGQVAARPECLDFLELCAGGRCEVEIDA